jgi:hypothetical protein
MIIASKKMHYGNLTLNYHMQLKGEKKKTGTVNRHPKRFQLLLLLKTETMKATTVAWYWQQRKGNGVIDG